MASLKWLTLLLCSVVVLFVGVFLDNLIKNGYFHRIFDHFPGECVKFEGIDGSEDFVLMPNDHVLISSGVTSWPLDDQMPPHRSGIYMIDLSMSKPKLVNLTFDGSYREHISPDFTPHGMGHWVTEEGEMILYVINHRRSGEFVDSFMYDPSKKSLRFRRSFQSPLFHGLNDLVLVDLDEFYVTIDHYFETIFGRLSEVLLKLPLGQVLHVNGKGSEEFVKVAINGVKSPNGIAKSNDGRFIFVNEQNEGSVNAYIRNKDRTLLLNQTLPLHAGIDNIFVSPVDGHLWVAHFVNGLQIPKYIYNHSEPVPGRVLHIAIDQNANEPFTNCKIEEVVSTTGERINAVTIGLYHRGKLLLGTIRKDMMLCEVPYLMYSAI